MGRTDLHVIFMGDQASICKYIIYIYILSKKLSEGPSDLKIQRGERLQAGLILPFLLIGCGQSVEHHGTQQLPI